MDEYMNESVNGSMNDAIRDALQSALKNLLTIDTDTENMRHMQAHFALAFRLMTECYAQNSTAQGVLIFRDDNCLKTVCIGLDELTAIENTELALEHLKAALYEGAPEKGMLN